MNPLFNTVRDPRLRQVLESDNAELQLALENQISKASLVLAGGIVEAVLINFLLVIGYKHAPKGTEPKNMQLGDLITACEQEGALAAETVALCQVLKEYRNLIHPGRSVRNEELADEARAKVAEQLVERVVGQVDNRARRRAEWAAEATLDAILALDNWNTEVAARRHLRTLSASEAERLVVELLPDRFAWELSAEPGIAEDPWIAFAELSRDCFRVGMTMVSPPTRAEAARRLMRELEKDPAHASEWLVVFFSPDLLAVLEEGEREDCLGFVLESVQAMLHGDWSIGLLRGVGPYLPASDARQVAGILTRVLVCGPDYRREWAEQTLLDEMPRLPSSSKDAARELMDKAIDGATQPEDAASLSELRYEIWPLEDSEIPR